MFSEDEINTQTTELLRLLRTYQNQDQRFDSSVPLMPRVIMPRVISGGWSFGADSACDGSVQLSFSRPSSHLSIQSSSSSMCSTRPKRRSLPCNFGSSCPFLLSPSVSAPSVSPSPFPLVHKQRLLHSLSVLNSRENRLFERERESFEREPFERGRSGGVYRVYTFAK